MENLAEKVVEMLKPKSETQVMETETSPKEVIRELKESYYLNKDITDFFEFKIPGKYPSSGEFQFQVDSKYLKYASGILKHTSGGSKLSGNLIKVTLFKNQLRLSGFNQVSFSEIFIPLSINSPVGEEPIFFIFDYPTLSRIVSSFEKVNLTFTYKAGKNLLCMQCDKTTLELATFPEIEFTNYSSKIKSVKSVECLFQTDLIQNAIEYLSLFVKKDQVQPGFSQIEVRDSCFLGGSGTSLGVYKADNFKDNPLKLKYEDMQICNKVLPYLYSPKVKLFESETYFIIRDQNVYVGFEKITTSFPAITTLLQNKTEDSYTVSRQDILRSFNKLSVVTQDKNAFIMFRVEGNKGLATLTLSLKDVAGRISKDVLTITRNVDCEIREYYLPLDLLGNIVSFFKFPNVQFFEKRDKAVYIKEDGGNFQVTSILSSSKE